ncbi:rhomboid family intramembrane serine protease [soil metagenome]
MDNFVSQLLLSLDSIKTNFYTALLLLAGFWVIHIVNVLVGYRLNIFGVYPRHVLGLIGIPCFSFLHGNFSHLFFNSMPLLILLDFVLINGKQQFICTTMSIMLLSGSAIWLFGRSALHIGASSLVMGYWSYLLVNAYEHFAVNSLILAIVCIYYFGGLVLNLFPSGKKVSWEGHVFGFLAGLASVYICH